MMKNPIFRPLLSCLLVTVTLRASSALAYGIAPDVTTSRPTVNDTTLISIRERINHLTDRFIWLQDNMTSSQHFHDTIENVAQYISNLPSELAGNRADTLNLLYMSQDRFKQAKEVLNEAAKKIKSYCKNILDMIRSNEHSGELLHYTTDKVVSYLDLVDEVLENACNQLINLNEVIFPEMRYNIIHLNATLNVEAEKINERKENNMDHSKVHFTNTYTRVINPTVAPKVPNKTIGNVQESVRVLLPLLDQIGDYIKMDDSMTNIRHANLDYNIKNHAVISIGGIESKFEFLKVSIIALKNACTNYINNERL